MYMKNKMKQVEKEQKKKDDQEKKRLQHVENERKE